MSEIVAEGKNIVRDYVVPGGMFKNARTVRGTEGRRFFGRARQDAGTGGGIGLRQVHARPDHNHDRCPDGG